MLNDTQAIFKITGSHVCSGGSGTKVKHEIRSLGFGSPVQVVNTLGNTTKTRLSLSIPHDSDATCFAVDVSRSTKSSKHMPR